MALFDKWFGKKEETTRDALSVTIKDLEIGDIVDYFMKSWEVKEVFKYDWGNNSFTKEYQLFDGTETVFLHVEEDDKVELSLTRSISLNVINPLLRSIIIDNDEPPATIEYSGTTYFKQEEAQGHVSDASEDFENESAFVSWDYTDRKEKKILTLERSGEQDFDAFIGENVDAYEFSNIVPKN